MSENMITIVIGREDNKKKVSFSIDKQLWEKWSIIEMILRSKFEEILKNPYLFPESQNVLVEKTGDDEVIITSSHGSLKLCMKEYANLLDKMTEYVGDIRRQKDDRSAENAE